MMTLRSPYWVDLDNARRWRTQSCISSAIEFHRGLQGYCPTSLVEMPRLATELGVGRAFVKDESSRLGLPAFKVLGASWAIEQALSSNDHHRGPVTLVAATDGNHGRAVARLAAQRGLAARIFIPEDVHPAAVAAIAGEGASIVRVKGDYDAAVACAEQYTRSTESTTHTDSTTHTESTTSSVGLLIQDMAWPGYEQIPAWIVEGYTTMFTEIDEQLHSAGAGPVDLLVVPVGVGSLAQAAVAHYRRPGIDAPPALVSVEPDQAACVLRSLQRDEPVTVDTSATIMAGLNCGTPSSAAWPYLRRGLNAAVSVSDAQAGAAALYLAGSGVPSGPCGAATLAGSRLVLTGEHRHTLREHLGIDARSTVVLLSTESSTANPIPAEESS